MEKRIGRIMAKRIIMRIELSSVAKERLGSFSESSGLIQMAITSRLLLWFVNQDDAVQASILGLYANFDKENITTAILKQIISDSKYPKRGIASADQE